MCGIAGIIQTNQRPVPLPVLQRMTDALAHRGPDGDGIWAQGCAGLGHRRLAILDLTSRGQQPMQSADGRYVIIYNGEIYNFRNLRLQLQTQGYVFQSDTDTEVLLYAYHAWGADCVHRFNGMFAFAVWDRLEQALFLARDRYGIKPLYYTQRGGALLFASEIKSLQTHPHVGFGVDLAALNEYFSFQNTFSDRTLFDGIRMLPPAHTLHLRIDDPTPRLKQYWDYHFQDDNTIDEQEAVEELDRLFEQAVQRQLVSDVEVGSYLSGGIDSGAITAVASQSFGNLKTFTCGFDLNTASGLELSCDERERAEYLSYLYKTEHYEVVLKAGDMERVMPQLIWHLEDLRVGQCYPNFYVSRLASKFVKVCLSGAGGDELFAGYPWRYYRAVQNGSPEDYVSKYYHYWQRLTRDHQKADFFQPDVYRASEAHPTLEIFRRVMNGKAFAVETPEDYVNRSLYFEAKTFLHGLLVVEDKLSMAHGLETRVPFLDNDLVDFAMRVPVRYKLRHLGEVARMNENEAGLKRDKYFLKTNDGKLLLRKALRRYVPDQYANGVKQGFSAPDGTWFKGESLDYIRDLLVHRRARIHDYLQPSQTRALIEEHCAGKVNHRLQIWSLLCFEWWLRTFDSSQTTQPVCPPRTISRISPRLRTAA